MHVHQQSSQLEQVPAFSCNTLYKPLLNVWPCMTLSGTVSVVFNSTLMSPAVDCAAGLVCNSSYICAVGQALGDTCQSTGQQLQLFANTLGSIT